MKPQRKTPSANAGQKGPASPSSLGQRVIEWSNEVSYKVTSLLRPLADDIKTTFSPDPAYLLTPLPSASGCEHVVYMLGQAYGFSRRLPYAEQESSVPLKAIKNVSWTASQSFMEDLRSRIWMTYRSGFVGLPSASNKASPPLRSDTGWGCMLRAGQSLLGEACLRHCLGRSWRRAFNHLDPQTAESEEWTKYIQIIYSFLDNPKCPFSIHRLLELGQQRHLAEAGHWAGPSTVSILIREAVSSFDMSSFNAPPLACYVVEDATIYLSELKQLLDRQHHSALLLLLPLRLGTDRFNPVYLNFLQRLLELPHALGIAGGHRRSALYFMGYFKQHVLFLDPHTTQSALSPLVASPHSLTEETLASYHCSQVHWMDWEEMDPSLLVGLYCSNWSDVEDVCTHLKALHVHRSPAISISEAPRPRYLDAELEVEEDEFDSPESEDKDT